MSNAGESAGSGIKKAFASVHGAGEALRGNINTFADSAVGTHDAKNERIAERGVDEIQTGKYQGTGAGGIGTHRSPGMATGPSATGNHSTNYGPHSSNLTNKLDPRFDSDTDHRGTAAGSTNYGSHGTNMANKADPRLDSDMDHRGTATTGTSYPTGTGMTGTTGFTNYGPHSSNLTNKLDPRFDSDTDHRGTAATSTNYGPHGTDMANKADPRLDSDMDHRGPTTTGAPGTTTTSTNAATGTHPPHKSNLLNKLDPRV
ncbi:hypothetical protein K490DRAFT_75467 [Saccharata proteae CBS 121410]|uniref:Cell surface protein n=1 Tax=Saccharata proteae CBS 121410 TaxID=1314787 RepID=A0A9P4HNK2_9PEZI|nr:hypothetical protein K490DRAFT_75467 [Saccharata proteae CBS 121410]